MALWRHIGMKYRRSHVTTHRKAISTAPCGARLSVPWRHSCRHMPELDMNVDAARQSMRHNRRRVALAVRLSLSRHRRSEIDSDVTDTMKRGTTAL